MMQSLYNPVIAEVLYKSTFLESWGSGVRRIISACHANGIDEPVWTEDGGFINVTFRRPYRDGKNDGKKLTLRQQRILAMARENPAVSMSEMAVSIGVSVKTIERDIPKMAEYMRHAGPKNGGYWEVLADDGQTNQCKNKQ